MNAAKTPETDLRMAKTKCWSPGCTHRAWLRDWAGWQWCLRDWYRTIRWGGGEKYWWYVLHTRIFLK